MGHRKLAVHLGSSNVSKYVVGLDTKQSYENAIDFKNELIGKNISYFLHNIDIIEKEFNNDPKILTFQERINPDNILDIIKDFDIICDCSDNFGTRYLINDACLILNKPLVFGSVQGFEGQISVFQSFSQES